jgi:putative tryptophan/tyrosine transport system substrate-binding protein
LGLKEAVPTARRIGHLTRPLGQADVALVPWMTAGLEAYHVAARALGVHASIYYAQSPEEIATAFDRMVNERVGAVDVAAWQLFWIHRQQILDLAAKHRLPTVYGHRTWVLEGGLMSHGVDDREAPRRLAVIADKLLKGAKPADLPVEQPTKFELVINLKTAKALGLTIPPSVLARADEVIQ